MRPATAWTPRQPFPFPSACSEAEQFERLMVDWDDAFAADCADTETAVQLAELAEEGYRKHGRGGWAGQGCGWRRAVLLHHPTLPCSSAKPSKRQRCQQAGAMSRLSVHVELLHVAQALASLCLPVRRLCVCLEPAGAAQPQGRQRQQRQQGLWRCSGAAAGRAGRWEEEGVLPSWSVGVNERLCAMCCPGRPAMCSSC